MFMPGRDLAEVTMMLWKRSSLNSVSAHAPGGIQLPDKI